MTFGASGQAVLFAPLTSVYILSERKFQEESSHVIFKTPMSSNHGVMLRRSGGMWTHLKKSGRNKKICTKLRRDFNRKKMYH